MSELAEEAMRIKPIIFRRGWSSQAPSNTYFLALQALLSSISREEEEEGVKAGKMALTSKQQSPKGQKCSRETNRSRNIGRRERKWSYIREVLLERLHGQKEA